MGLNVASVKSYVSSALTTTLFGSGVGEREVGKLTSIIMNKMLFAQGWQFSVEVDGLEGADFFAKDITYHDYSIEYETIKIGGEYPSANGAFAWADNNDGQGYR